MEIKTKYEIGDSLWTVKDMKIKNFTVTDIAVFIKPDNTSVCYYEDGKSFYEEGCFTTKEALIEQLGV